MKRVMMGVLAATLIATPAWAARTPVHEAAESQEYGRKFGGMIGRGLINAATCFVDLIVNVVNETRTGSPLIGTLVGVGKGTGCTSLRVLSGAVDLTTFWVPGFNGFPVSDSYENCLAGGAMSSAGGASTPQDTFVFREPSEPSVTVARTTPVTRSAAAPAPAEEKPKYTK